MTIFQGIISGPPGTAKTGLLCSLADAGYTIIRAAFEPGEEVFRAFCTSAGLARVHTVVFEDNWEETDAGLVRLARGMTEFEAFLYNGKVGKETPFGRPAEWGPEIVLVYDTLTSMGEVSESRALKLNSSTREGRHLWQAQV